MKALHDLAVGLLLGLATVLPAEPPKQGRELTAKEEKELAPLAVEMNRQLRAGQFEDAAQTAKRILDHVAARQGESHWQVINTRLMVERLRRWAGVATKDRAEMMRALGAAGKGEALRFRLRYREAEDRLREALTIWQKTVGEQHPETGVTYSNLAHCLDDQARYADALPLHRKALAIARLALGEQHPDTATGYNNLGRCLDNQGKHAEALPLYQKALAIRRKALGELHPHTAQSYNNVASCLGIQGQAAAAVRLCRQALAINRQLWGEQHFQTAHSYNNLARCLDGQGENARALPLHRKALTIYRQMKGEQHPDTARGYSDLASCLDHLGQHADALPLHHKALAIRRKTLGEQHPDTATSYDRLAFCLFEQDRYAEAARTWEKALPGSEWGRLQASTTGFDRSQYNILVFSPRSSLAACLVRLDKPLEAWQHAEADLARGLLDDLLPSAENRTDAERRTRLRQLGQALLPLVTRETLDAKQVKQRDALVKESNALLTELAASAARRLRARVLPLPRIQKQIPADAALVFWLDVPDEHLGCVLRRQGPPAWVKLPSSEKKETWTRDDWSLPRRVVAVLADGQGEAGTRRRLLAQLHRQRLAPLEPHLKGVRHLLVVPAGPMSTVPIEVLTDRYAISYVPSASVFARQAEQHRPLQATSLLVLADPAFRGTARKLSPAPAHGLLILGLTPGSLASQVGLRPGDVLLEYGGKKLSTTADLVAATDAARVPLKLWREGRTLPERIPAGKLGAIVDKRPIAEALAAWRKQESALLALDRGGDWQPLPGTRLEAAALAALVPRTTALLGADARQQKLAELAASDRLRDYRLLHLATHGQVNAALPRETALILAQDHIDDAATATRAVLAGKQPVDGRLTVGAILKDWQLDADLVVLSACQTGLGKHGGSEGMLGFTQALLQKGARSVVLSRWKVDDAATALLMAHFYENLLGARKGTKPLGRATALAEAKTWLRGLSRAEATKRLAALVDGVPRGERGSIKAALPTRKPDAPKGEDRPFAAPYYWAAFILIGDPD